MKDSEYEKIFGGKRFALVNTIQTQKKKDKVVNYLTNIGDEVKTLKTPRGYAIYHHNKKFID